MKNHYLALGVLAIGWAAGSFLDRSSTDIATVALWYVFLCQTWNIVGGMAGQFSFAHPVYIAIGGYTSTALFHYFGISPWIGMFVGVALAMLASAVLCWINFRQQLPMLTYALITLAFTSIGVIVIRSIGFLGGNEGLLLPRANDPFTFRFLDKKMYFYIILAAVCVMLVLTNAILQSSLGKRLIAIRDNQNAARMLGIDVLRMTLISSIISAGLGALGGTFYAQYMSVMDPSVAGIELAVQIVLLTAVGGIGTVWGPFWGPLVLIPTERLLGREFVQMAGLGQFLYGVLIIIVLLVLRDGIVTWASKQLRARRMKKQAESRSRAAAKKVSH